MDTDEISVKKRLFVAVYLPQPTIHGLLDALRDNRVYQNEWRFSSDEKIHLTLAFLGGVDEGMIPGIIGAVEKGISRIKPFDILIENITLAPPRGEKKMIWANVRSAESLDALAATVKKKCVAGGAVSLKKTTDAFTPHITLAKKRIPYKPLVTKQQTDIMVLETIPVTEIHLVESKLSQGFSRYTILHTFTLGKK
jgi:2'-5' RNA ligase